MLTINRNDITYFLVDTVEWDSTASAARNYFQIHSIERCHQFAGIWLRQRGDEQELRAETIRTVFAADIHAGVRIAAESHGSWFGQVEQRVR